MWVRHKIGLGLKRFGMSGGLKQVHQKPSAVTAGDAALPTGHVKLQPAAVALSKK